MKKFELWLDESGDFENDAKKKKRGLNPSLVGGILVEKGKTEEEIFSMIPETGFHSTEEKNKDNVFDYFCKIAESGKNDSAKVKFVVFSNDECISVLNNELTYLNVISSGIIKLLKTLKIQYKEDIHLDILIAVRKSYAAQQNSTYEVVQNNEYKNRIAEKLYMEGFHDKINDQNWSIDLASARYHAKPYPGWNKKKWQKLVLADIVCNTFLLRNTAYKKVPEKTEYLNNIYQDGNRTYKYTVLEEWYEKELNTLLLEGRIGEAISFVCEKNKKEKIKQSMNVIKECVERLGDDEIKLQYQVIAARVQYYQTKENDFAKCLIFLDNLLHYFLPMFETKENISSLYKQLQLDIYFYQLTAYTHTGNVVKAEQCTKQCELLFLELANSWQFVDYRMSFQLRVIINMVNAFKYEEALIFCEEVVKKCTEIKELLSLLCENEQKIYYNTLAKALGTQVQIKTALLRQMSGEKRNELYISAKTDSDKAFNEFEQHSDKLRQCNYRVQLEIEAEKYEEALLKLFQSNDVINNNLIELSENITSNKKHYELMQYVRLMGEGKKAGWNVADEMFESIEKTKTITELFEQDNFGHPEEIIFWKYACYLQCRGSISAAEKYYDKAIEICSGIEEITMNIIGFAIECEKVAMAFGFPKKMNRQKCLKNLAKSYERIKQKDTLDMMNTVFGDVSFAEENSDYYLQKSRCVTF